MKLALFVDKYQMADRGLLTIGEALEVNIRGFPLDGLTFLVSSSAKTLDRTGLLEYVFAGEIEAVRTEPVSSRPGQVWQQVLLNCGVPITLNYFGAGPFPLRLNSREASALAHFSIGGFIAGVMVAMADVSFVDPSALARGFEAKLMGISVVRLGGKAVVEFERNQGNHLAWSEVGSALGGVIEIDVVAEASRGGR